jgi:hypothetical protein
MDEQLKQLAEKFYGQEQFLRVLFDLALDDDWFQLQHLVQHDMAKAVLADYSCQHGKGYLDDQIFYDCWEQVIDVGWQVFCGHTHIPRETVISNLKQLRDRA